MQILPAVFCLLFVSRKCFIKAAEKVVKCNIFLLLYVIQYNRHNGPVPLVVIVPHNSHCSASPGPFWVSRKLKSLTQRSSKLKTYLGACCSCQSQQSANQDRAELEKQFNDMFVSCNFRLWAPGRSFSASDGTPHRELRLTYQEGDPANQSERGSFRWRLWQKQNLIEVFCVIAATETKSISTFICNYEKCFSVFSPSVPSNVHSTPAISRLPSYGTSTPLIDQFR